MKTLKTFFDELQNISFDKKKVQGLVKRANNAGYNIYYAYHEDGVDSWKNRWSEDDYKESDSDVKIRSEFLYRLTLMAGRPLARAVHPFARMTLAPGIKARQLAADAPSLLTACGLALRSFDA